MVLVQSLQWRNACLNFQSSRYKTRKGSSFIFPSERTFHSIEACRVCMALLHTVELDWTTWDQLEYHILAGRWCRKNRKWEISSKSYRHLLVYLRAEVFGCLPLWYKSIMGELSGSFAQHVYLILSKSFTSRLVLFPGLFFLPPHRFMWNPFPALPKVIS